MNVGVLRGGVGHEYDISLKTGGEVLRNLPRGFKGHDILITKDGLWHLDGIPVQPTELNKRVDVIFNALHGRYGEDGQVQRFLDTLGISYTGPGHFAAAMSFNKSTAKQAFTQAGLRVPRTYHIDTEQTIQAQARDIFTGYCPPWVVKPADNGSSIGVRLAKNISELIGAIEDCFQYSSKVIVEEYIRGKEVTCGIIEGYRSQPHYFLLPIEIQKPRHSIFGYEHKYGDQSPLICPGTLTALEKQALETTALAAYQSLGLRHYATIDCVITPTGIYVLEANSLPGLTTTSPFTKGLQAVGGRYPEFLEHIITKARR